jgi:hypothetical protein
MIRRSTVVYVVLLLVAVGAYFYLNKREKPASVALTAEPTIQISHLFAADLGTPTDIRIEAKAGNTAEVAQGADKAWMVTQPIEAKADQGAAEAAATQITTMHVLDTVPDVDPKVVGLETPEYVLTVKFTQGAEQKIDIGVVTPSESGYYVRDPDGKVVIVTKDSVDALLELLNNPPYQETLTPSPTSTETLTPSPATATSEAATATP